MVCWTVTDLLVVVHLPPPSVNSRLPVVMFPMLSHGVMPDWMHWTGRLANKTTPQVLKIKGIFFLILYILIGLCICYFKSTTFNFNPKVRYWLGRDLEGSVWYAISTIKRAVVLWRFRNISLNTTWDFKLRFCSEWMGKVKSMKKIKS